MYALGGAGVRLGFALAGIRVDRRAASTSGRARCYACNHSSNIEPPAVFLALRALFPRLRVLYKAELRKLPVLVWVFDVAGFVPLERGNPDQSWPAIDARPRRSRRQLVLHLSGGHAQPDGGAACRSRRGLRDGDQGAGAVVPVAVRAAARDAQGQPLIWPATVTVELLPPVPTAGLTLDDRDAVVERVRDAIDRRLPRSA